MSRYLVEVNSIERVLDTIRHEIAHALTSREVFDAHGFEFLENCVKVKATPRKFYTTEDTILTKSRYEGKCPTCDFEFKAYRKRKRAGWCNKCFTSYDDDKKIVWYDTRLRTFIDFEK